MSKEDEGQKSKYNEAALQIIRLHELHLKIEEILNNPNIDDKMSRYHFVMDSVWRELSADVLKLPANTAKAREFQNQIYRWKLKKAKSEAERYNLLNERHIFLKRLQEEVGKGGIWTDGREDNYD